MDSIVKRRLRFVVLGASLTLVVATAVYAWTLATPEVGPPASRATPAGQRLWAFGFVGDTQQGEGIFDPIFARLREERVEFVLHLGDLVENADHEEQWQALLASAARHHLQLKPVVGNHDRLPHSDDRGEANFQRYFPQLPCTFYSFREHGIQFVMLNSERSLLPASEQGQFLRATLASHSEPTIVCLHRPVFSCCPRDWPRQAWHRVWLHGLLQDSPTVLTLSGHHHYYERTRSLDGITYVISGGGSRKLHGAQTLDGRTSAFRAGCNHYGVVDVHADQLHVRVLDLEGELLDQFTIPRRKTDRLVQRVAAQRL